jgi:hypothetical protein
MGLLLRLRLKRQNLAAVEINVAIAALYITERGFKPQFPGDRRQKALMNGP